MKRAKVSQALFAKVAANKSQVSGKGDFVIAGLLGVLFLKQTLGLELDPSPPPTNKNTSVPTIITIFISGEPVVFLAFACLSGFLFPFKIGWGKDQLTAKLFLCLCTNTHVFSHLCYITYTSASGTRTFQNDGILLIWQVKKLFS